MDDHILPAREVRKIHTESSSSFATPEFGPLGQVDGGQVLFRRQPQPRPSWQDPAAEPGLRIGRLETRVTLVQAFTGMEPDIINDACARGPKGLAIVGFGRGNVPPAIVPALRAGIEAGILVTISSRSIAGRVSPRYGYDGGGLQLRTMGAILAGDLSGAKARLLQMVVLGMVSDVSEAKTMLVAATA
jgi:L-asparaginase